MDDKPDNGGEDRETHNAADRAGDKRSSVGSRSFVAERRVGSGNAE